MKSLAPQKSKSNWRRAVAIASFIIVVVSVLTTTSYMAPITGAIFTTGSSCDGTNINIFNSKSDVYVDGGPAHEGAAGLPDGFYYIQVTEPGGALLGTSVGSATPTPIHVTNGKFDQCYQLEAVGTTESETMPQSTALTATRVLSSTSQLLFRKTASDLCVLFPSRRTLHHAYRITSQFCARLRTAGSLADIVVI